jgi:L-lactate dehydrogenase complex protein LldG
MREDSAGAGEDEILLARFTALAEGAAAVVHRCHGTKPIAELVLSLAAGGRISVSPTLESRYPELVTMLSDGPELIRPRSAGEASLAVVGVAAGEAPVAETGSILVSEYELGDRVVSMLSPVLVQVVRAETMLATLDEVGVLLTQRHAGGVPGYHALVTGPSRTADIERSLTVGVQGPAELHVAILDEREALER